MQQVVAFGVVAFVLVTASDFDTTAPVAVAFAYVILLTTAIAVGPVAFDRISSIVGGASVGGGGGKKKV